MHTFAAPKLLTLPASIGNRDHINSYYLPLQCVSSYGALPHNYYGNLRLSEEKLPSQKPDPLEPKNKRSGRSSQRSVSEHDAKCSERGGSQVDRYSSDSNVQDNGCGRHFLFDKRWKNGEFRDEVYLKTSSIMTPLPRAYQTQKSLYRISLCRQNKPSRSFCPFEGYNITSFQSRLLPATSTVTEKTFSMEPLRHRPRINNRTSSLFSVAGNQKNHSFPDPVAGAPSSFIQRLSEISSMEGETIRQEKAKRTKRIKKAD